MSNTHEHTADPTRLSEEGGMFAALSELRGDGLSQERLAHGADVLAGHIAGNGAAASASGGAGVGLTTKLGLLIGSLAVIVGAWYFLQASPQRAARTASPAGARAAVLDAGVRAVAVDAGVPTSDAARAFVVGDASAPIAQALPPDAATRAPAQQEPARVSIEDDAAPPSSQLPEQLRLLKEANAMAKTGQHSLALERLTELASRFPNTPLKAEMDLRRALSLSGSGQLAEAGAAVRTLLEDPRHAGRWAELHHMLADILLQEGRCIEAEQALEAGIAAGLGDARHQSARRGVERCKALGTSPQEK